WFSGGVMRKLSVGFAVVLVGALTACGLATAPSESSLEKDLKEKSERLQKENEEAAKTTPPVPKDGSKIPVEDRKMPSGKKISMVGDSVMLASVDALQEKFPGATVDAAQSRHYIAALPILQQMADAGTLREFVVLGLGTNGPSDGAGDPEMLKKIREAVGKDRVIIYVMPYGDRDWMAHANDELIAEAKKTPNVYLANWCEAASENDDFVDGIHPGEKGAKLYAGAVENALKQWKSGKKDIPQSCSM
ncbi:MAG: acetyltransferase, partial [Corynebacterium urealyticum]